MEAAQEKLKSQSKPNGLGKKSFFSSSLVQTKLSVNLPGDKYELEADQAAEQVVQRISDTSFGPPSSNQNSPYQNSGGNFPNQLDHQIGTRFSTFHPSSSIQTKCNACEEENIQRKPEPKIWLKSNCKESPQAKQGNVQQSTVSPETTSQLFASKGGGNPLPKNTRSEMERGFGVDFSGVRTHTGFSAINMSKNLGAQAFTHGSDIYFNSGKFETQSQSGKKLLAHELTHVVQQRAQKPGIQRQNAATAPSPRIERRYGLGMRGRYGIYDAELNHDTQTLTLIMRVNFNFTGAWPSVAEQEQWQQDFISQVTSRWSYRFYLVPSGTCNRPEMDRVHFARVQVIPTDADPHYNINVAYSSTHQTSSINSMSGTGSLDSLDTVDRERTHDGVTYRQRAGEHEFGHMLGLPHIECDTTQQSCPGGYGDERSEHSDVMGSGWIITERNYSPFTGAMYYFSGCNWEASQSMP